MPKFLSKNKYNTYNKKAKNKSHNCMKNFFNKDSQTTEQNFNLNFEKQKKTVTERIKKIQLDNNFLAINLIY